ncbi:hypothetical protein NE850_01450 [Paraburkholderia sp. USG1]|uniref:hypothetical protein n=1 Tax=Paraburkholderia sp. USG1 TaxID=2952268 RepID=UPI002864EF73|nr:hypothetical protein [Paraburkholderia sp. USG1]MDR8394989.1 hypothetical protein [Paraburkholderia sp. USG1]
MPYATVIPTPARILAAMQPGQYYAAYAIAAKLGVGAADIKHMLETMVGLGVLSRVKRPCSKVSQFIIAGTKPAEPPPAKQKHPGTEVDPTTIAAPRTYSVLTGQLTDYEAEIARRQSLCMLARGAR